MPSGSWQTCLCSRWSAKVLWGSPGDFGAIGQDSIVGQSFILLNAESVFFRPGRKINCVTIVHLADLQKAVFLRLKG